MLGEILILGQLHDGAKHGYDINRGVAQSLGSAYLLNPNTLYPTLRRLEQGGAVTCDVQRQTGKPDRHVYQLTESGEQALLSLLQTLPPEAARRDEEFYVRVAYLTLLDPSSRLNILRARRTALLERLAQLQGAATSPMNTYHERLLSLLTERIRSEVTLVDEMAEESNRSI